jgi:RNA polymerase sigma-70 factor (ECF subfamily)
MTHQLRTRIDDEFAALSQQLRNYFLKRTGSVEDSEELVQETYIGAVSAISGFQHNRSVQGWLYGIARHKLADYWRSRARNQRVLVEDPYILADRVEPEEDDLVLNRLMLSEALQRIPKQNRHLVLMSLKGYSASQVADRFQITVSAAEKRLARAKARVRQVVNVDPDV